MTMRCRDHAGPIGDYLAGLLDAARQEARAISDEEAADGNAEALIAAIFTRHRLTAPNRGDPPAQPAIQLGERYNVNPGTTQIRSGPGYGTSVLDGDRDALVTLPLNGDLVLLCHELSPDRLGAEGTVVEGGVATGMMIRAAERAPGIDAEVDRWLAQLDKHLAELAETIAVHNQRIEREVREVVERRSEVVHREREQLAASKYPITERPQAPRTFTVPPITPRPGPPFPKRAVGPRAPLTDLQLQELFGHILRTVTAATGAMERSPANYREWSEEQLRDVVLLALNMVYESRARAEAFNASGHTDLLIAVDGQNLFIDECKIWHGSKAMEGALKQLMGYSTWRDSRLAITIFVHEQNITEITEKARKTLEARVEFVRWIDRDAATPLIRIRWPDDVGREATLAVVFCHLPRSA
jgi:hypothetical protein